MWDLATRDLPPEARGAQVGVTHVALTGDGRAVSASDDGTLRLWDLASGACLKVFQEHMDRVNHLGLAGDGRAVSASSDGTLRVWDLASGACLQRFSGDAPMLCCAATTDAHTFAAGDGQGAVHILRLEDGRA